VAADSAAYVQTLGPTNPLHPDYGATGGYRYAQVPGSEPKVPVAFYYDGDPGPYPIPPNPPIEADSDHHLFILDTTNCVDYELYNIQLQLNGTWLAGSGAIFPLNSNQLRAAGHTSADAAGLPMMPGMVRYDEVASGAIHHAIRFTGIGTADYYIWPARHSASANSGPQYPPMGQRFRLKADFDISGFPAHVQVILSALKKYGMILADNGTSWHISGIEDSRWNDTEMHTMTQVVGADFEAVDESSLMVDPNSAAVAGTSSPAAIPTGSTELISEASGYCLDVVYTAGTDWGHAAGTPLQQWPCWGGANQQFRLTPAREGYTITSVNSGMLLTVSGNGESEAERIVQEPNTGTSNQIWSVSAPDAAGYVTLTPQSSGQCLDVVRTSATGMATDPAAPIQQWPCWGGTNQKWKFATPR
jgi:hypothetical protein